MIDYCWTEAIPNSASEERQLPVFFGTAFAKGDENKLGVIQLATSFVKHTYFESDQQRIKNCASALKALYEELENDTNTDVFSISDGRLERYKKNRYARRIDKYRENRREVVSLYGVDSPEMRIFEDKHGDEDVASNKAKQAVNAQMAYWIKFLVFLRLDSNIECDALIGFDKEQHNVTDITVPRKYKFSGNDHQDLRQAVYSKKYAVRSMTGLKDRYIDSDVYEGIKKAILNKFEPKRKDFLSNTTRALLQIFILYRYALRKEELVSLKITNFPSSDEIKERISEVDDSEHENDALDVEKFLDSKTYLPVKVRRKGKYDQVPFNINDIIRIYEFYEKHSESKANNPECYVFPSPQKKRKKMMSTSSIDDLILSINSYLKTNLTTHFFRHTSLTNFLARCVETFGGDVDLAINLTSELASHKSEKTTQNIYTKHQRVIEAIKAEQPDYIAQMDELTGIIDELEAENIKLRNEVKILKSQLTRR